MKGHRQEGFSEAPVPVEPVAWRYRYIVDGEPTQWYLTEHRAVLAMLEGEVESQPLCAASPAAPEAKEPEKKFPHRFAGSKTDTPSDRKEAVA